MALSLQQSDVFEQYTRVLQTIGREHPLMLVLDDLQWADDATLRLLHYLARNITEEKVMIIGAYRPEELKAMDGSGLNELIQRMGQEKLYTSLDIKRLDIESIELMVKDIMNVGELPANFVKKLYDESEGNPYFVEEVVRSLIGEGVMEAFTGGEVHLLLEDMKIPSTIKDVIWRRLGGLDDNATRVIMLASVIGSRFDFDALHKASGLDDMRFLDALDKLIALGLVHEEAREKDEVYKFDHAQVRAVIYDSLTRSRKRLLHKKIGEVIEEQYKNRLDDAVYSLARHFYIGKDREKAFKYILLSAEKATKQFALEEATRYFETSLSILSH
ncbi:MAG: AAA family ATPase, partial [Thermoplasmata archaeon]|nr:AAA family ATPase [Thermoplasmata archaeon]